MLYRAKTDLSFVTLEKKLEYPKSLETRNIHKPLNVWLIICWVVTLYHSLIKRVLHYRFKYKSRAIRFISNIIRNKMYSGQVSGNLVKIGGR